jgi:hypothetical protein
MAKAKAGRPSKYRPEFPKQVQKLAELGATDMEIANFLAINVLTLYRWKHTHEAFCKALTRGKAVSDKMVEDRLFARATGYTYPATKIFQYEGKPVTVPYTEHCPPDTTAAIFWLKNRKPAEWRDRVEHTGADGEPVQFLMLNRPPKKEDSHGGNRKSRPARS